MKVFLGICALGLGTVLLFPKLIESLPQGTLRNVVEFPGVALSRMSLTTMDPATLIVAGFVLLLILSGVYGVMSR